MFMRPWLLYGFIIHSNRRRPHNNLHAIIILKKSAANLIWIIKKNKKLAVKSTTIGMQAGAVFVSVYTSVVKGQWTINISEQCFSLYTVQLSVLIAHHLKLIVWRLGNLYNGTGSLNKRCGLHYQQNYRKDRATVVRYYNIVYSNTT